MPRHIYCQKFRCFVCQITAVRIKTRKIHGIDGNASEDFFAALFLYPNVALQLDITTDPCQQEKLRKSGQSNETYKKTECSTEDGSGKICGLHLKNAIVIIAKQHFYAVHFIQ